jgi:hypothetical protein
MQSSHIDKFDKGPRAMLQPPTPTPASFLTVEAPRGTSLTILCPLLMEGDIHGLSSLALSSCRIVAPQMTSQTHGVTSIFIRGCRLRPSHPHPCLLSPTPSGLAFSWPSPEPLTHITLGVIPSLLTSHSRPLSFLLAICGHLTPLPLTMTLLCLHASITVYPCPTYFTSPGWRTASPMTLSCSFSITNPVNVS